MNRLDISSTGFPETTKTWFFTQTILKEGFLALAKLAGENIIIEGVEHNEVEGTVTDGYIVYNDEIIKFVGGVYNDIVSIIETTESVPYNTDINDDTVLDVLPAYTTRIAMCGIVFDNAAVAFAFDELKPIKSLYELSNFEVNQATEEEAGIAEIATQLEANANVDDQRIITAKKLNDRTASTARRGVTAFTTTAEVNTGTDATKAITIAALRAAGYRITKATQGTILLSAQTSTAFTDFSNNWNANVGHIYPPSGFTMAHFVAASLSFNYVGLYGDVNTDDRFWMKHQAESTRLKVIANFSENDLNTRINYLVIWQK